MKREARRWTAPRLLLDVTLVGALSLDLYAMYAGWFGWDRGGFHGPNPAVDNWDGRSGRGALIAIALALALAFLVVGWPVERRSL